MKFDIKNKKFKNYSVYLDGVLQKAAIEADDKEGWVRIEEYCYINNNMHYDSITKTKYGKIHIVRMENIPIEEYRDLFIIVKYENFI